MIPSPPLVNGKLTVTESEILSALAPGMLQQCCVCRAPGLMHWGHERRFVPLHAHCVPRLFEEWRAAVESGETLAVAPSGRPLGAYARRQAASGAAPRPSSTVSIDLGSPYFRPGMPEGAPWTAVAQLVDGTELITPCDVNEAHALKVNDFRRASAARGFSTTPSLPSSPHYRADLVAVCGWVVTPTGAVIARWMSEPGR